VTTSLDFSKEVTRAKPLYLPEEGTEVEQAAMAFHAKRTPQFRPAAGNQVVARNFRTNGALPMAAHRTTSRAWMTVASA
jgi:hypothetical protein